MSVGRAEMGLILRMLTDSATTPVSSRLCYDCADPYAVRLRFPGRSGPIEWLFARELLDMGLLRPTGEGDVRAWPTESGRQIFLELSSPSGQALFSADSARIRSFLNRTWSLVRPGEESGLLSWDSHLSALLGDASDIAPPEHH